MKIGFVGTGVITEAVVRGICASDLAVESITVSPRSAAVAKKLVDDFACVSVAKDNQEVVDRSQLVFVALRARIAEEVLKALAFRPGQKLVTFIATATSETLARWTGHQVPVLRAVPLPFVAEHKSVTPIFPADEDLQAIFSRLGGVIEARDEHQLNVFMAAGSLMGVYFRFAGLCAAWLKEKGLAGEQANQYMATLFYSLADKAKQSADTFAALEREYSTEGGTNELIARLFTEKGGGAALQNALDEAFARIAKN